MSSGRPPAEHHNRSKSDASARSTRNDSAQQSRRESQQLQSSQLPSNMDLAGFTSPPTGKVAIPPLHPRADPIPSNASLEKKRTSKACTECRLRKIKCSGKKPTCEHCEQCQIPCVYADGKREQNKRATERGDRLLQIVRDISREVDLPSHLLQKVQAVEFEVVDDDMSVRSAQTTATKRRRKSFENELTEKRRRSRSPSGQQGEADVSADVGSEESVDLAAEDFNRTEKVRATGFMGKNSEVAWAQRLSHAQVEGRNSLEKRAGHYGRPGNTEDDRQNRMAANRLRRGLETKQGAPLADFTYHRDTESVLTLDHVDKDELPPLETAKKLLSCYLNTVQDALPILAKSDILNQFRHYSGSKHPESLPATWRAVLNMVFALGSIFSHLTNAPWQGDERDHFIYYTRALHLGLPGDTMTAHPDLQRIQVIGLISFYYMAISQVSRSWVMIGLACRHAIALGLHLRNIDDRMDAFAREKRVKVWWSLYYVEYILCEITGRPSTIDHRFCSVPAPAPIEETRLAQSPGRRQLEEWNKSQDGYDTPSSGSKQTTEDMEDMPSTANQFRCRVKLAVISQKIFVNLYSAHTVTKSWKKAQDEISSLGEEVDGWYRNLPKQFQFIRSENDDKAFLRERMLLAFSYYSTKMILNRPCLCRVDQRIEKQGQKSKNIDMDRARECINAARSMCDLLPDTDVPNIVWIYTNGPWWCIVHHLMQAMTVLMLELAFEVFHMANPAADQDTILQLAKKLLRWLTMMAALGNEGARSACKQARDQFKGFAPFEKIDTSDLVKIAEYGPDMLQQQLAGGGRLDPKRQLNKAQGLTTDVRDLEMKEENVWPKTEQPGSTEDFQSLQGITMDSSFGQGNIFGTQQDLLAGNPFQEASQETWTDPGSTDPWHDNNLDPFSPLWKNGFFQTSYDLNNPLTSLDNSLSLNQITTGPPTSLPHHMAGMNIDVYAGPYVGSSQIGSTAGHSGAAIAQAQQPHQQEVMGSSGNPYLFPLSSQPHEHQTTDANGHVYQYPPPSQSQESHPLSSQSQGLHQQSYPLSSQSQGQSYPLPSQPQDQQSYWEASQHPQ